MLSRSESRVDGGPHDAGAEAGVADERMVEIRPPPLGVTEALSQHCGPVAPDPRAVVAGEADDP